MKVLSSKKTFYFKKIFPLIWFGFLFLFLATGVYKVEKLDLAFMIIPLVMMVFGFFLFKSIVWMLADEVKDCGEYLIVKRKDVEERIMLADIFNVSMSQFTNPPRISLRLRKSGKLGDEVLFMPIQNFRLNPFARNEIAEDLMKRTDSARSGR
jgi:hypothetical protein